MTPAKASVQELLQPDDQIQLGVLGGLVGYHVRRASGAFAVDFRRALAATGIRQVLFGIMSLVSANPGVNQGAVGRTLGIQRANMVALINELVDAGLIERRTLANDRRAFALALTDRGVGVMRECQRLISAHEDAMTARLSAAERRTRIELLGRLATPGR